MSSWCGELFCFAVLSIEFCIDCPAIHLIINNLAKMNIDCRISSSNSNSSHLNTNDIHRQGVIFRDTFYTTSWLVTLCGVGTVLGFDSCTMYFVSRCRGQCWERRSIAGKSWLYLITGIDIYAFNFSSFTLGIFWSQAHWSTNQWQFVYCYSLEWRLQ